MRATTKAFTEEVKQKAAEDEKEREERAKKRKPKEKVKMLTQEELLIEAKKTEVKNIKSWEELKRIEADKKKPTIARPTIKGPKVEMVSKLAHAKSSLAPNKGIKRSADAMEQDGADIMDVEGMNGTLIGVVNEVRFHEFEEIPAVISQGAAPCTLFCIRTRLNFRMILFFVVRSEQGHLCDHWIAGQVL